MSIRAKTKRRLVILLALAGSLLVLGVSGYAARRWYQVRSARAARVTGMEAAARGDNQRAVDGLAIYLYRFPSDPEANYRYAMARLALPLPEDQDRNEALARQKDDALKRLRAAVAARHDYPEAQRALLDLYTTLRPPMSTEAIAMADRLLATSPQDRQALKARATSLMVLRRYDEAMPALDRYLALVPDDFAMELSATSLLSVQGKPPEQVVARAQAVAKKFPGDARFEVLLAAAYQTVNDRARGLTWALKAADHPPTDPLCLSILIQVLDSAGRYGRSLDMLESVADAAGPAARLTLIERLWQTNQYHRLLDRIARLTTATTRPAGSTPMETDILGYQVMALRSLQRTPEAAGVLAVLAKRQQDARAQAWALFLTPMLNPGIGAQPLLEACRQSIAKDGHIGVVHFILGQMYQQSGEADLALHEWEEASRLSPAWAAPFSAGARLLARLGRTDEALVDQEETYRRAPGWVETRVTVAIVQAACLTRLPPDQVPAAALKLLDLVKEVRAQDPAQPDLSALEVELLVYARQPHEAGAAIERIIADTAHPPSGDVLLNLAQISDRAHLGLGQACLDSYRKALGMTPALALAQAQLLAGQGKAADGRHLLESARDQQKDARDKAAWQVAYAQYLDQTGDPQAAGALRTLAQDQPDSLAAQSLVLHARAAANDRDLQDQCIQRLRAIMGDAGVAWRLARVRWLLGSPKADAEKNTAAAMSMLQEVMQMAPHLLEPRLLLVDALIRQGNRAAAIEQLRAAQDIAPDSAAIALELARQLQGAGDAAGASAQIARVLKSPGVSPLQLRETANLLTRHGDTRQAMAVLERIDSGAGAGQAGPDLLLAGLYARAHENQKAQAIARQALAQERPTPQEVEAAADVLLATGKPGDARTALSALDKPGVIPADHPETRELILARFALATAKPDEAQARFKHATELAPGNEDAWRGYLTLLVQDGKTQPLLAAAEQAAKVLPPSSPLLVVQHQSQLLARLGPLVPSLVQPLVASLMEDPAHQAQAIDALGALCDSVSAGDTTDRTITRLTPIAQRDTGFLALQMLIAHLDGALRRWDDVATIASRAATEHPYVIEPLVLAYQAASGSRRWSDALAAARKWRDLAGNAALGPDLAIAECYLKLGQPGDAHHTMEPYLQSAREHPEAMSDVVKIEAQCLGAGGNWDAVPSLLRPVAAKSGRCRLVWMDLASDAAPDEATAASWLREVAALIPNADVSEQVALATHWLALGKRPGAKAALANGRALLEKLADRPDTNTDAVLTLAVLLDVQNDLPGAEARYRQALKLNPNDTTALNNLAMVLVRRADAAHTPVSADALALIDAAVKQQPHSPQFLDTQAAVLVREKQFDKAITAERQAAGLDPTNTAWPVTLASILVDAGQVDEAAKVLAQIDTMMSQGAPVSPSLRAQLDTVRRKVIPTAH